MKPTSNAKLVVTTLLAGFLAGMLAGCSGGTDTAAVSAAPGGRVAMGGPAATSYTSVKWGGGGFVTGIVYHPTTSNVRYARTDVGGAYRWEPGTGSWLAITDGVGFGGPDQKSHDVESIAVDPTNDQKLYLVAGNKDNAGGRIYISSDRGNNWTWVTLPFTVGGNQEGRGTGERLQLDPTNPSTMFYGSRTAGLWKSSNSGLTWSRLNLGSVTMSGNSAMGVQSVIFDNSSVGGGQTTWIIYAAVAPDYASAAGLTSSLYKSVNGGFSWTPVTVPTPATGYYIPHMVRSTDGTYYVIFNEKRGQGVTGPSYLYKYVAWNGTWTQLNSSNSAGFGGVSIHGSGSTTRVALALTGWANTTNQQVQLSDDAGATWREIEYGMGHTPTATHTRGWNEDIEIDPFNRDHIAHLGGEGIVETWNASSATPWWNNTVPGIEETATLGLVTPPAGATYKLIDSAGDIGAWVYTDLTTRTTKGPVTFASNSTSADMAWSDPQYIATSMQDNRPEPKIGMGYSSGDGGITWTQFPTLPAGAAANGSNVSNLIVTARNKVVWAPPNVVPSYTTNNGASWTATNLPAPSTSNMGGLPHAYRLKADRKNPNKVYAYDQGGEWWGNPGKVYVSTDGGHNFTLSQGSVAANLESNAFGTTSMEVNPNAEGDIWLADGNAVYHSLDSGATWTKVGNFASIFNPGQTEPATFGASSIALGKAAPGATYSATVYVVGVINGVWGVYQSDDGGASWTRFNDNAHQYGGIGAMAGDWNTYGRIYFAGAGRGVLYTN
ncbi:hypothetical protein SAMN05216552_1010190 [Pseudoduganella namucuonensis]|uniref:Dockerin n=1 Tax=Pseudoduganella namucuonensis TaxID=1035707 RepID=A0A1I7J9R7_9BURK|nr:hypothetical protein SAMN05216552_1010190 [Pseudoduganella namucuonensis]